MMSKLSLVHMVRSAKLVMVGTLPSQCSDGRFHSQVCHFSRLGPELDPAASTAFGRTEGKMAELLMKSATVQSTNRSLGTRECRCMPSATELVKNTCNPKGSFCWEAVPSGVATRLANAVLSGCPAIRPEAQNGDYS